MQRLSSQSLNDATATLVQLPNEEFKGRIIGKRVEIYELLNMLLVQPDDG